MNQIEFIARVRHLAWIAYQMGNNQPYNLVPNKDQWSSLIDGVEYALEHPDMTPEQNHENWMQLKLSQGWVYGPVKDFKKKTHPYLVLFGNLPNVEKRKDAMDSTITWQALAIWNDLWKETQK